MHPFIKTCIGICIGFCCVACVVVFLLSTNISLFTMYIVLGLIIFYILQFDPPCIVLHERKKDMEHMRTKDGLLYIHSTYVFPFILSLYLVAILAEKINFASALVSSMASVVLYKNIILYILLISAIIIGFFDPKEDTKPDQYTSGIQTGCLMFLTTFLAFGAMMLLFVQIRELGSWLQVTISLISGTLIFMIGVMMLEDEAIVDSEDTTSVE